MEWKKARLKVHNSVKQKVNDLEHRMEQLLVEQKVYMMVSLMVYTMECMMV